MIKIKIQILANDEYKKYLQKLAVKIAINAHDGQVDKVGKPYIYHCLRVGKKGKTSDEKILGVLHDVIEDTNVILDDLKPYFSKDILKALECITHLKNESRVYYYERIKKNPLALAVKLLDVEDNLNRLEEITDLDTKHRLKNKYEKALEILKRK